MSSESNNSALAIKHKNKQKKQFLRFCLEPETTIMLPIDQVTEVLKIPLKKIVPISQMSVWTMGVYNWRGEVLWMVDLGHLLGLGTWQEQQINHADATAIILSSPSGSKAQGLQRKSIGLIINKVDDIEWCDPEEIKFDLPSTITPTLKSFLNGYWLKPEQGIIFIVDGQAIFRSIS